jgi:hypothetical protein
MFTGKSAKGCFFSLAITALFLGALTAAAAGPVTLQEETPPPSKTFEIEGGSLQVSGGILVSLGPRVALSRNREHLRLEYLVTVRNQSKRRVWVEVAFQLPGTNKIHRKREPILSKQEQRFAWKVEKRTIQWDAEYTFTVSAFADKRKKKPLGAETYSFLFDDKKHKEFETAQDTLMEILGGDKLGNILVSGWPDGLTAERQERQSDQALLVLYRTKKRTGRTATPIVYVDDVDVARLDNGRFFSLYLKPGTHEIKSDMANHPPIQVDASPGDVFYLEMTMMVGAHQGTGRFFQAPIDTALNEIKKLKPLDRKWVRDSRIGFEFTASEAMQQARQEEPITIPAEKGLHVLAVKYKVTEKDDLHHRIEWRATVLNNTVQFKKFDLTIQFLDSDGSIIEEDKEIDLRFGVRAQKVVLGFSMVTTSNAQRVKTVGASISQ